jgi:hypothetical protein
VKRYLTDRVERHLTPDSDEPLAKTLFTTPAETYYPTPISSGSLPTDAPDAPGMDPGMTEGGRERRVRKSVNYAEPKLNTKMRKPRVDSPPPGARRRASTTPHSSTRPEPEAPWARRVSPESEDAEVEGVDDGDDDGFFDTAALAERTGSVKRKRSSSAGGERVRVAVFSADGAESDAGTTADVEGTGLVRRKSAEGTGRRRSMAI